MERVTKCLDAYDKRFPFGEPYVGSKEGGALRRASLDLTRALSTMRKA
jgi:hypothetical protein